MSRAGLLIAVLLIGPLWAAPAMAQDPRPEATAAAVAPPSEPIGVLAGTATAVKAAVFQAQLEASTDEKSGTAVIGWKKDEDVYALTFRAPLNSAGQATPLSLDGLSNGASVQFGTNHLFWRGPSLDEQHEIEQLCSRVTPPCDYQTMAEGPDRTRLGELLHLNDTPWFVGGSAGLSVSTFDFVRLPDLTDQSDTRTNLSLTARAGLFRPELGFLIGTLAYQRTSRAGADPVSLCRPIDGTDATSCSDAVLAAPVQSQGALVTIQVRRLLPHGLALSPSIQHDTGRGVTAIVVPLYFLKDSKGTPMGGVRGSWRSDTHRFIVSLFVGAAFQLMP